MVLSNRCRLSQGGWKANGLAVAKVIGVPGMSMSPIRSNGFGVSPHLQSNAPTGSMDGVTSRNEPAPGAFVRCRRFPSNGESSACSTKAVSLAVLSAYSGWAMNRLAPVASALLC